jgi:hypothetical protein
MFKKKDLMRDLTDYIKKNLKKGYTQESLRWALVNQGYSKIEVEKALGRANQEMSNEAPILNTKPEIKYELVEPKEINIEKKTGWRGFLGI